MITSTSPATTSNDSEPETTGRQLITFTSRSTDEQRRRALAAITGINSVSSSIDPNSPGIASPDTADATIFDRVGIAVATVGAPGIASLGIAASDTDNPIIAIEPEYVVHALAAPTVSTRQLADTDQYTWGLQATGVTTSPWDGGLIRVAVLDTGFDLNHPDFVGRNVSSRSFVAGQAVQDGHGHGTHCIGTSCGPRDPAGSRRYGIASEATIYAGKVLSDQGSGTDSGILAGINWAIANRCAVISMSLGADIRQHVAAYEAAGRRALNAGTLIIAAAGNNAHRPTDVGFVGSPANATTIMAVGALTPDIDMAWFSAGTNPIRGGQVDIAGPGLDVFSSWPMPQQYNSISGTSMATPHVAGIAALYAQQSGKRGRDLWALLIQEAQRLPLASTDVGSGLVYAPQ